MPQRGKGLSRTQGRASSLASVGIVAALAVAGGMALFYRPIRDVPGPELMPLLAPTTAVTDAWEMTPHETSFSTFVIRSSGRPDQVSIHPLVLPGGARLEVRPERMQACRVVRVDPDGKETTLRLWKDRGHFDNGRMPGFSVSPDGKWVLYTLLRRLEDRVASVRAFSLSGGPERQWDVPIAEGHRGVQYVSWRQDSTGWLAWDEVDVYRTRELARERAARQKGASALDSPTSGMGGIPLESIPVPATLWTADVNPLGNPPRVAVQVNERKYYPAVIGPTDEGLTLAIDCTDTRLTSRFNCSGGSRSGFAVLSRVNSGSHLPEARSEAEPKVYLPLIAFDESQGVRVVRRTRMLIPTNCDSAALILSPDGHTIAWWVTSNPVYDPPNALLRQWDPQKFGKAVLRRYGGNSLWVGDVRTGVLRLIGKVKTIPNKYRTGNDAPQFSQLYWGPDGSSLLFQRGAAEYYSFKVTSTAVK